jgi:hypothetical protein
MSAVQFDVSYQFAEYREFVLDHLHNLKGKRPGVLGRLFVTAIATPMFFLKTARMPLCSFTVDAGGISRRTAGGELKLPWRDVTAVHRYSPGYLIEKNGGAVPIPYRCLTEIQRSSLDAYVAEWESDSRSRVVGDV